MAILALCFISSTFFSRLYSQEESAESLIDLEFNKIQEEFQQSDPVEESIPQSKLLEELQKPGNEHLLEQLKNGEKPRANYDGEIEQEISNMKEDPDALGKDMTDEKTSTEEEDKKLKVASSLEKYFDKNEYFQEPISLFLFVP